MQYKVYDVVSKIERTVMKKAYDIINKGKKRRYEILETLDDQGNVINAPEQITHVIEKKTEPESPVVVPAGDDKTVEAIVNGEPNEGIHIVRKKPGPKPKIKNA